MTAHEYRLVRRNGEREDEEDRMDEPDGLRLWSIILREGARIMTAIITMITIMNADRIAGTTITIITATITTTTITAG